MVSVTAPRAGVTLGFVLLILLSSFAAEAQEPSKTARIGFLSLSAGPTQDRERPQADDSAGVAAACRRGHTRGAVIE